VFSRAKLGFMEIYSLLVCLCEMRVLKLLVIDCVCFYRLGYGFRLGWLVALSRRNIVLVSLQDLSLHQDFSSHQEVWAELALRSLKKNGIRIRK